MALSTAQRHSAAHLGPARLRAELQAQRQRLARRRQVLAAPEVLAHHGGGARQVRGRDAGRGGVLQLRG